MGMNHPSKNQVGYYHYSSYYDYQSISISIYILTLLSYINLCFPGDFLAAPGWAVSSLLPQQLNGWVHLEAAWMHRSETDRPGGREASWKWLGNICTYIYGIIWYYIIYVLLSLLLLLWLLLSLLFILLYMYYNIYELPYKCRFWCVYFFSTVRFLASYCWVEIDWSYLEEALITLRMMGCLQDPARAWMIRHRDSDVGRWNEYVLCYPIYVL